MAARSRDSLRRAPLCTCRESRGGVEFGCCGLAVLLAVTPRSRFHRQTTSPRQVWANKSRETSSKNGAFHRPTVRSALQPTSRYVFNTDIRYFCLKFFFGRVFCTERGGGLCVLWSAVGERTRWTPLALKHKRVAVCHKFEYSRSKCEPTFPPRRGD